MPAPSHQPDRRRYKMGARAEAVAQTRGAIIEAAWSLRDPRRITIAEVAERAGVSQRTVLRHFGSRDRLVAETIEEVGQRIEQERLAVRPGDIEAAIDNLVDHYEQHADHVLIRLAEEGSDPALDQLTQKGREMHSRWTATVFSPQLARAEDEAGKRRLHAQLTALCDIYFWKLLRRDSGLGVGETKQAIAELIRKTTGDD